MKTADQLTQISTKTLSILSHQYSWIVDICASVQLKH